MPSTDRQNPKRANIPLKSDYTREFQKDWDRLLKAGKSNLDAAKEAMLQLIANAGPMPAAYKDHALKGQLAAYRELHIRGDFLLMYRIEGQTIVFVRLGTHADLFRE